MNPKIHINIQLLSEEIGVNSCRNLGPDKLNSKMNGKTHFCSSVTEYISGSLQPCALDMCSPSASLWSWPWIFVWEQVKSVIWHASRSAFPFAETVLSCATKRTHKARPFRCRADIPGAADECGSLRSLTQESFWATGDLYYILLNF